MSNSKGDKAVICKHWLRGLCKKGDDCEFLHEYDMSKMPECYFYSKYSQCGNKECEFLHLDKESKIKDCAWYDRGFCRHGIRPFLSQSHITLYYRSKIKVRIVKTDTLRKSSVRIIYSDFAPKVPIVNSSSKYRFL